MRYPLSLLFPRLKGYNSFRLSPIWSYLWPIPVCALLFWTVVTRTGHCIPGTAWQALSKVGWPNVWLLAMAQQIQSMIWLAFVAQKQRCADFHQQRIWHNKVKHGNKGRNWRTGNSADVEGHLVHYRSNRSARAGFPGPFSVKFWISPKM